MYAIHRNNILIVKGLNNLKQARAKRQVGGDLVVDEKTNKIVTNPNWLFDWERHNPDCCAQRAIQAEALSLNRRK